MANDLMPGKGMEQENKKTEVATDTKLSVGTKITLTVIVLGSVVAGVYLALRLTW